MRIDSMDLQLFVATAETGSLAKGAKLVHLSPAAASERLRALESRVGKPLFYRDPRGLVLNTAGGTFVRHARIMLRQMTLAEEDLAEEENDCIGHLRICANTTAVTEFMPEILGRFMAQRPRVTVDLTERSVREVIREVNDGSVDFGIAAGADIPPQLQSIHFSTDHMVLVVPRGHALADRECTAFSDTFIFPHIGLADSTSYGMFMKDVSDRLSQAPQTRIQLRSFEAMCSMIAAGVGIGVVPESAALRHARSMPLNICRLSDGWALRERKIVARDMAGLSACANSLVDEIRRHFGARG